MTHPLVLILSFLTLAYLAGSIPFGLLIARCKGIDIRAHGSGNIGATNVGRVLGKKFGILCFALDLLKGLIPSAVFGLWITARTHQPLSSVDVLWWLAAAACAIFGHMFPVWLKFKGGKGVATSFGALLGIFPVLTIASVGTLLVWLLAIRISRMVGISSCIAALAMPVLVLFELPAARRLGFQLSHSAASTEDATVAWPYIAVTVLLAALVIVKHRANISRTIAGTEPKVNWI